MSKSHRDPTDFRDNFSGVRMTERLSTLLEEAAPINKSAWVCDAIEAKLTARFLNGMETV
jgi:hypothetical protein